MAAPKRRPPDPRTVSAGPLHQYFADKGRGEKTAVRKRMGLRDPQMITNWLKRGIPLNQLPALCDAIGMTEDAYRVRAGLPPKGAVQSALDSPAIVADIEKLPPGLRAYIGKKARQLRELWENNPILHEVFTPPKDPARYAQWERDIEALIHRMRPDDASE